MASMRVHELAKEFNMSSKDMLDKLHEMRITAKSHASMLAESDVEKVRQNLSPEIKERAGELPAEEAKQLACVEGRRCGSSPACPFTTPLPASSATAAKCLKPFIWG